jgi:hypothetical protein
MHEKPDGFLLAQPNFVSTICYVLSEKTDGLSQVNPDPDSVLEGPGAGPGRRDSRPQREAP